MARRRGCHYALTWVYLLTFSSSFSFQKDAPSMLLFSGRRNLGTREARIHWYFPPFSKDPHSSVRIFHRELFRLVKTVEYCQICDRQSFVFALNSSRSQSRCNNSFFMVYWSDWKEISFGEPKEFSFAFVRWRHISYWMLWLRKGREYLWPVPKGDASGPNATFLFNHYPELLLARFAKYSFNSGSFCLSIFEISNWNRQPFVPELY